ncbi:DUF202 domain-containing protein [Streptomyces sp. NPDC047860]|uniref:DUF202 domain-containing protein n=1 Tax=Streptomyces sp. NPDC047860 TaxID=3155743 RepID=UPI0033E44B66
MSGAVAPVAERDPGLQPERTRLAWRRTTLSSTVMAVLAGKTAVAGGGPVGVGVVTAGVVCCVCWVGFLVVAHRRIRGLAASAVPAALGRWYAVAAVGCVVVTVGCGVGLVLRG